ncbi:5-formyltetrahydrofolate cyclo-ligase [Choanephora cucurbitarum]|uniref:5-formyltetrahydrofolate cyclo-ligase n=1 Tax=Choanephora cucurbitarum TaxID=101091 RepID=A0A1C7N984_9FUNG|nr:5-formyltetrahydrofolate cyclo-ligase [Choanephora cucurbitarum]
MNQTIVTLKKQLRKDMAKKLKELSAAEIQNQSHLVFKRLQQLDHFKNSKNISVYISMPSGEIMTKDIIRYILNSDKRCYIPRCHKNTMDMVRITTIEDFESLPNNKWNIPEPPLDQPRQNALEQGSDGLDLILVPGVAFDRNRNRIGHGKGYYDRYIRQCKLWAEQNQLPPPKTVALSLEEQIVEPGRIPLEDTDQTLDTVLTCTTIY